MIINKKEWIGEGFDVEMKQVVEDLF